jgi:hypothetical protein
MSGLATELENEMEFQFEHESEHEQEAEHEAFFNHLAAMADRAGRSQGLRRIALAAARSALRASGRSYPVIEGEMEFEGEGELEARLAKRMEANRVLGYEGLSPTTNMTTRSRVNGMRSARRAPRA